MALTATKLQVFRGQGQADIVMIKVVAGNTADYPTGGYTITPGMFGFNAFETDGQGTGLPPVAGYYGILADAMGTPTTWFGAINPVNGNLQAIVTTTGVEAASNANVNGFACLLEAYGH